MDHQFASPSVFGAAGTARLFFPSSSRSSCASRSGRGSSSWHRYNCRSSSAIAARMAARNSLRLGVGLSTMRSLNFEAENVSRIKCGTLFRFLGSEFPFLRFPVCGFRFLEFCSTKLASSCVEPLRACVGLREATWLGLFWPSRQLRNIHSRNPVVELKSQSYCALAIPLVTAIL